MNQIYQQRTLFNKSRNSWGTPFTPVLGQTVGFPTLKAMLSEASSWLETIPVEERYNLFYTLNPQLTENKREARFIENLAFDIDKMPVIINSDVAKKVHRVICEGLELSQEKTACIVSGNGIHILIELAEQDHIPIDEIDKHRVFYKAICTNLEKHLHKAGFTGAKLDPSIFDVSRVLRLPGTINLKPDKAHNETWENPTLRTKCYTYAGNIEAQRFNLQKIANIPVVAPSEAAAKLDPSKLYEHDWNAIKDGCDFLKWCKQNPTEISEPEWYAMLSIVGNVKTEDDQNIGVNLAQEYSEGHPSYTPEGTSAKLQQALDASGPRFCKSVNTLWGKCSECKWNGRVATPLQITGDDFIATKVTGFWRITTDSMGNPKPQQPEYDDMLRQFKKQHVYKAHLKRVYTFNKKFWDIQDNDYAKGFAERILIPKPLDRHRVEFQHKVYANEVLNDYNWFAESVIRKANFRNGVFDLHTRELLPHSATYGFKSVMDHDYDPEADCPRFKQFLEEVTIGDKELQDILMEFMGYAISGMDPRLYAKILILYGEGRNGKSVFLDSIRNLVGKGYFSTVPARELTEATERVSLDGKLFNIVEEMTPSDFKDTSFLKEIATGGVVSIRNRYKDSISMKIYTKLIMACNQLPRTPDHTVGLYRRLLIVPFNAKFDEGNRDIFLSDKLAKEASGIFNLAMKGLDRLIAQGRFTESKQAAQTLMTFQEDMDPMQYLITNYLNVKEQYRRDDSEDFISKSDFFEFGTQILIKDNFRYTSTKRDFINRANTLLHGRDAQRGRQRIRGFLGVSFKKDVEESENF